ncbi:hypothetical protein PGT21_036735 [Puccinia graminis f. sp. tritici]|uniref:Uncharacterized protein n=1 Tax=Puccinia graminis f. sp. tritici TaxID=56615 RepID=A0A5B0R318_PUCGR|nr:hypothetical protein PGT21_036735 [Puccinia graminis f. sp. tritici]
MSSITDVQGRPDSDQPLGQLGAEEMDEVDPGRRSRALCLQLWRRAIPTDNHIQVAATGADSYRAQQTMPSAGTHTARAMDHTG